MKKSILIAIAAIMFQLPVYCQVKNYSNKGKIKILGEKTKISIHTNPSRINPIPKKEKTEKNATFVGGVAILGAILPPLISGVKKGISEGLKKNALKFKAEYKGNLSVENFYSSDSSINLPDITITRIIQTKSNQELAVRIKLKAELSFDKTAFRYKVVDSLIYNYSIAKTVRNFDYIDLNLQINFKNIFISKNEYVIKDLRTTNISIPLIHVGFMNGVSDDIYSGWIPLPTRSTDIAETETETDVISNNTGLYEIEIVATETNPYKIKAENKNEMFEATGESVVETLKALLESLTTKKE